MVCVLRTEIGLIPWRDEQLSLGQAALILALKPGGLCSQSYTCQSCEIHYSVVDEAEGVLKHWCLLHPTQHDSYFG